MIAVDTNVLVRYAVKDNYFQTLEATDFLANHICWVHKTVLLETVWVLSSKAGSHYREKPLLSACGIFWA